MKRQTQEWCCTFQMPSTEVPKEFSFEQLTQMLWFKPLQPCSKLVSRSCGLDLEQLHTWSLFRLMKVQHNLDQTSPESSQWFMHIPGVILYHPSTLEERKQLGKSGRCWKIWSLLYCWLLQIQAISMMELSQQWSGSPFFYTIEQAIWKALMKHV